MKKISFIIASLVVLLTACQFTTSKSYTFDVDTGDQIEVSLDTTGGFDLSATVPFTISQNGNTLSQGTFIYGDVYDNYVEVVNNDVDAVLIDSGKKNGNEYIFWCYEDVEFNYAILVRGSDTGLVIGNLISEESAKECFERLTISVAD